MPLLLHGTEASEAILAGLEGQVNQFRCFDAALADRLKQLVDRIRTQLHLFMVLRADLEASVERTTTKLRTRRALELQNPEHRLEIERRQSLELSSTAEKVVARYQKSREELESNRRLVEEAERTLAAMKAGETKLLQVVKASREEMHAAEDQASIASACVSSLEDEWQRKMVLSEEEIRAEARERLHQDKADRVKELEEHIKKLGYLQ